MNAEKKPRHKFTPPTQAEVADYAAGLQMPNPQTIAAQFIDCYAPEWRDTFNRPIRNWKMKFRQVWAKRRQHVAAPQKPVANWTL